MCVWRVVGGVSGGQGGGNLCVCLGMGGGKPEIICEKKWQKNEPNI